MTTTIGAVAPDEGIHRSPVVAPVKFERGSIFHRTLRERVETYFRETGRKQRDCWQMYLKSVVVLLVLAGSYFGILMLGGAVLPTLLLAVVLGGSMALVGFNVQHDGGHRSYSTNRWINKCAALTLDMLGASSYVWARKHNSIHHSYTNITDHDDDIDVRPFGRLSPHQPRIKMHRVQHLYLWFLYGFLPVKWHFYDDFRNIAVGQIGCTKMPRPKGLDLAIFIGGKIFFFGMTFVLPMFFLPWWLVIASYGVATFVEGVGLSVVFQLAHCVEEAEFPMPTPETHRIENCWAVHQVETTVDFAPRSRVLAWLVGGLNCQVEHHLFPQICHIHYPAISKIVEDTCREFGLRYLSNPSLLAGISSHFRFLRQMGRPALTAA